REAGSFEALAEFWRHADEQSVVARVALGVAADFAESSVDSSRRRKEIEELRRLSDDVRALGDLDRIAFARLRDRIAERAAGAEAIEAVALVAPRAGDVTRFAVVGRCWEDAAR